MPKYSVRIERISYASQSITVTAKNIEAAKAKAMDEAGDLLYDEYAADYEVDHAEEVKCPK